MKQEAKFKAYFSNRPSRVGNHRGQAVIEYVLLLVVVISLLLGARGLFTSMNNYMSNVMGEYIACLMEQGELPTMGVADSDLKQHKEGTGKKCVYPGFSVATTGNSTNIGTGGGKSSSGTSNSTGGSNSGKNSGSKNASKNSSSNNSSSSSNSSSGSGGSSSSRRSGSPYSNGQVSHFGEASTADNQQQLAGNKKIKSIDDDEFQKKSEGDYGSNQRNTRNSGGGRSKYKAITGNVAEEIEKKTKALRKPTSTVLSTEEGYRLTVVKRMVTPPPPKDKIIETKDEEFSFGNIFKWLVIAGIVIACFVLFGGQVMNYSNSDS